MKNLKTLLFAAILFAMATVTNAQNVGINSAGSAPNSSAMLDVSSTTKGFLAPRMLSSERVAISTPATGLLVYQTDGTAGFYYYTGSAWTLVGASSGSGSVTSVATGTGLTGGPVTTTGTISLANTTVTAGSYTRATITVDAQGRITAAGDGAAVSLTSGVTGTLPVANGGTGQTTYAVGDLLYASTTSVLSKLTDVATGYSLISGGVSVAPSWGKIALTTHVSGTLPVANGGTGTATTPTQYGVVYASSTTAYASTAAGTSGQVLTSNGTSAPTWQPLAGVSGSGTNGYASYWSGTGTLGSEQYLATSRGGLGASMTAGAIGAIPYSTTTTTYGTVAAVATGNALISGGIATAPSWGKIGLTTHVTGTLPVGNGGTNATTSAAALKNLLPSQTSRSGMVLTTNGTDASWTTPYSPPTHNIGDHFQGGYIFWLDGTGQHGLIVTETDQSAGVTWCNNGVYRYTGTSGGEGLYAGEMNTAMIVAAQIADKPTGSFAAKVCADLIINESHITIDTWGDWYLPSKYELGKLYTVRALCGNNFDGGTYWASNESADNNAGVLIFGADYATSGFQLKNTLNRVRAIRRF